MCELLGNRPWDEHSRVVRVTERTRSFWGALEWVVGTSRRGDVCAGEGPRAEKAGQGGGREGCLGAGPAGHHGPGEREVACEGPVSGIGGQGMQTIPDYRILESPV